MTRDAFRQWVRFFAMWGNSGAGNRDFAAAIREHDPKLAALFEKLADASDEIVAYIRARSEKT